MAKVLGDSSAAGLVAVRAVAVGLVAPEHHGRAAEQVEGVARQPRVAIVARQHHGHALPAATMDSDTMIARAIQSLLVRHSRRGAQRCSPSPQRPPSPTAAAHPASSSPSHLPTAAPATIARNHRQALEELSDGAW